MTTADAQNMPAPADPGAYDPATVVGGSGDSGTAPRTLWRDAWGRMRRSRLALLCGAILALYVLVGLIGFTGVLSDETEVDGAMIPGLIDRTIGKSHQPPTLRDPSSKEISPSYWLGLDFMGRSVFWRLVYGTRVALTVALLASIIEICIGFTLGALAGYFGG